MVIMLCVCRGRATNANIKSEIVIVLSAQALIDDGVGSMLLNKFIMYLVYRHIVVLPMCRRRCMWIL